MTVAQSPLDTVCEYLFSQAAITNLVGTHIYAGGFPSDLLPIMPTAFIVLQAGGWVPEDNTLIRSTILARCYGESNEQADEIALALAPICSQTAYRQFMGTALLHDLTLVNAQPGMMEPDIPTDWPMALVTLSALTAQSAWH